MVQVSFIFCSWCESWYCCENTDVYILKACHLQFQSFFLFWYEESKMTFGHTAWKVSKYRVISGPYFPVFGLNFLHLDYLLRKSPYSVQMQENTDQK